MWLLRVGGLDLETKRLLLGNMEGIERIRLGDKAIVLESMTGIELK